MKRIFIFVGVLLFLGLLAGRKGAAEQTLFLLDWIIYGKHAPFFVAVDKGFYNKYNLEVKIERGFGAETIKRIATKAAPFGFSDTSSLVIARSKGAMVKEVAMIHAVSPYTLLALKEAGIKAPKDLKGKKIGSPEANAVKLVFPAFARANGLEPADVTWVTMPTGAINPSLLAGHIDVAPIFIFERPTYEASARAQGKDVSIMRYFDWGLDVYSNGLIVTDELANTNPDLVRRFVAANMEAWAWSFVHPDETLENFYKYAPGMSRETIREHMLLAFQYFLDDGALRHGIGYTSKKKMDLTIELITKYTPLEVRVPTEEIYTNEFLPQAAALRRAGVLKD